MKKKIVFSFILGILISSVAYAAVSLSSDKISYKDTTVDAALDNLFTESVNGKTKIAEAITNKGIETLNTDSYDTIVSNINNISTGITDADKKLYESLKYSGLVTEGMSFDEMTEILSEKYPNITYIFDPSRGGALTTFSVADRWGTCNNYSISSSAITWSGCWHNSYVLITSDDYDLSSFNKLIVSGTANAGITLNFTLIGQEGQGNVSFWGSGSNFSLTEIDISKYVGKYKFQIYSYPTYENNDWYSSSLTYMILTM